MKKGRSLGTAKSREESPKVGCDRAKHPRRSQW